MNNGVKYLTLFLPLILSYFLDTAPIISYITAWLGSFFLFYLSLTGFIAPLPTDLPFAQQMMRPLIIIQLIFCGFNFCSSIFYFLDSLGMQDWKWRPNYFVDMKKIEGIAGAQRYYLLGHISLLLGIYSREVSKIKLKYKVREELDWSIFLLFFTFFGVIASFVFRYIPGLSQLADQFHNLSYLSGTYAFCYAIVNKNKNLIFYAGIFYIYNFITVLTSGYKEPIIISFMLIAIFMYPYYKRLVMIAGLPMIYICFVIVPAYVGAFRAINADEDNVASATEVRDKALNTALENKESNWEFLTGRLSEIGMFVQYIESTPKRIPYYGIQLVEQALIVLVPRIAWKDKPITEAIVMQRVYDAGVVNNISKVSAKPMYIVDGYLSGGILGIMISLYLYGFALQYLCGLAESWFGGYFLGTAIMFNGLFSIFWRGLSFEFILNAVLYSLLTMWVVQRVLYSYDFLEEIHEDNPLNTVV